MAGSSKNYCVAMELDAVAAAFAKGSVRVMVVPRPEFTKSRYQSLTVASFQVL